MTHPFFTYTSNSYRVTYFTATHVMWD